MGRTLKWIIGIVVAVVLVLVIAVYIILSSYDFNSLKPKIAKAARDATGRELTIGGDIDLDIGLTPSLNLTDIKFQNAPWGSRPEMVTLSRFEVQVALLPLIRGNIEIKRFILVAPDILIETDKAGKSNLAFGAPKGATSKKGREQPASEGGITLPALTFNQVVIEKGRLTYRDGKTGKATRVNLSRLTAGASGLDSPVDLSLDGDFNKASFALTGTLGPLRAAVDPERSWPLKATLKAFGATAGLDGSIRDVMAQRGIDLGFKVRVQDWTKLSNLAGSPLPVKDPLDVSGRAGDGGPKIYHISGLKVALGGNVISGTLGANLAQKIPFVEASLSSDKLDLRPLLPKGEGEAKAESGPKKSAEKKTKVFPNDPLPLDGLKQVDGLFKLKVGKLLAPRLVVNDLTVSATMKGGRLEVDPLKATIGGGALNATMALRPRGQEADVATSLKIDGFEIGKMLKEQGITEMIDGNLDVDVDLRGMGSSVAALMAGLNGHTSVIMSQGRIHNRYIELLGGDIRSSVFRLLNPAAERKDYTAIRCMVSRFDIKKGLADSTALVVDTDRMSVVGEGEIDLRTEKLDLALKPLPKEGAGGMSLSLGELAKPFKLGGTLAQPGLAIDPAAAALALGKTIGGVAAFGPAGIAAALMGKSGSGDENPCAAAIEAAKTGVKPTKKKTAASEKSAPKGPGEQLKEAVPDVGKALKGLFGR